MYWSSLAVVTCGRTLRGSSAVEPVAPYLSTKKKTWGRLPYSYRIFQVAIRVISFKILLVLVGILIIDMYIFHFIRPAFFI